MGLRDKYAYAIQTAKGFRMEGSADERDGKLHFHGTVERRTGQQDLGCHQDHPDMAERDRRRYQGDGRIEHGCRRGGRRIVSIDIHGEVGRHAQQNRQGNAG